MNSALLLALWMLATSFIFSSSWFVHRHYAQAMRNEVQLFEKRWHDLEVRYARTNL